MKSLFYKEGGDCMEFVIPQLKHKEMFEEYKQEAYAHHETFINGDGGCSRYSSYEEWLKYDRNLREEIDLPEHLVGGTTYFVIDNDHMIGTLNIRHQLNDALYRYGGHIGYSVSVSRRRQGVATAMLKFAIEKCHQMGIKNILVTCHEGNIGSQKTIEKCGGLLENEIEVDGNKILRFWIKENSDERF